ncbi:Mobile element protein [Caballeronia sordidicola]|uniref:Mobile element protein n=1 Tax=Caballeronia sordidicola TaxID=196367 RepID=A0A242MS69_CABSO|nr:Mobile element protein [Caballeronia sordidicola]
MNASLKVQPQHLERGAYLYVRQSSMRQVVENVESTKRQYALRGRATALGWRDDQIITVDSDQGESGASASWREGFQRLVTDVGMGRASSWAWRCPAWQETMPTGIVCWRSAPSLIRSFSMRMVCITPRLSTTGFFSASRVR